ncbi:uncharacterized protein LOC144885026 isoform X2 [Branchiostoma floridae x Branchiostoma japonicum]
MCSLALLRGLGACQALCGVVAMWLGTLEILTAWTPYPGVSTLPIGCGIMFLLVGALGLFLAVDDSCAACKMGVLTIQSTLNCLLLAPLACISATLGLLHTSETRTRYGDTSTHDWHLHLEIGIICACVVETGAAGATAILCGCCEIFGCQDKTNIETVALTETTQKNHCKRREKSGKARFPTRPTSLLNRLDKRKPAASQRSQVQPLDVVQPRPGLELSVGRAEMRPNAVQPRITFEELGSFQQASVSDCASVLDTLSPLPGSTQDSIELVAYDMQTLPIGVDKATEADGDEESGSRRPPAFLKPLDSARIPPRLVRNRVDPEHIGSTTSFVSLDGSSGDFSPILNSNNIPGKGEKRPPVRKPLPPPSVLKTSTVFSPEKAPECYKPDGLKTHSVPSLEKLKARDFTCQEGEDGDAFVQRRDSLETFEDLGVIHSGVETNSMTDNDTKVLAPTGTKKDLYGSSGGGVRSAGSMHDGRSSKLMLVTEESLIMLDAVDKELDEAETLIESDTRSQSSSGLRRADEYNKTKETPPKEMIDKNITAQTAQEGSDRITQIRCRSDLDAQRGRVPAVDLKTSGLLEKEVQSMEMAQKEAYSVKGKEDHNGRHSLSTKRATSYDVCKKDDVTDVERELAEAEQLIQRSTENATCDMDDSMADGLTSPSSTGMNDVDEHIEAAETLIQMYEATEALQKAMSLRNLQALEAAITAVQRAGVEDKVKHEINRANKLLLSLRQLDKLKQEVLKLRQSTVSEIRSYNKPHPAVKTVMTAVYLLLGTREKDTESWQSVQILLSKAGAEGLKRRVSACHVAKIPVAVANRSRQFLSKYNLDEIRDVSAGAATLYLWATGVVQEVRDRAREQRQLNFLTTASSPTADTNSTT